MLKRPITIKLIIKIDSNKKQFRKDPYMAEDRKQAIRISIGKKIEKELW